MIKWKPNYKKLYIIIGKQKTLYNYLRNSSNAFIKKKQVRNYIFNRDNNKCNSSKLTLNSIPPESTSADTFNKMWSKLGV